MIVLAKVNIYVATLVCKHIGMFVEFVPTELHFFKLLFNTTELIFKISGLTFQMRGPIYKISALYLK